MGGLLFTLDCVTHQTPGLAVCDTQTAANPCRPLPQDVTPSQAGGQRALAAGVHIA